MGNGDHVTLLQQTTSTYAVALQALIGFQCQTFPLRKTAQKKITRDKQKRQIDLQKDRSRSKGRYKDYDLSELFEYSIDTQRFLKTKNRL